MSSAVPAPPPCLADGFALLHQPQRALAIARAARLADPARLDARLLEGAACKALGAFEDAIAAFRAVLAADPLRAGVAVSLANALAEAGACQPASLREAAEWLRYALALRPDLAAAHASLIELLSRLDDRAALEEACHAALAHDPGMVAAHQQLAALLGGRGAMADAAHHRHAAWGRQRLFIAAAPQASPRVLVLLGTGEGNIPLRYLLPGSRYTLLKWLIDAVPEKEWEAEIAALPDHDLVLNAIGEPELEAGALAAVARFAAGSTQPLLNPPAALAPTRRERLAAHLDGIADLVVPVTHPVAAGCAAPAGEWLFRPLGAHGGDGLVRHAGPAPQPGHVTAFHDFQSADGGYRKYRAIFIDRVPYPYHLAIADTWLVHYYTAGMAARPDRRAEEARFLADPPSAIGASAWAAVAAIGARLDLDYAGIDFSILADGRVLVFEANATMVVHPEAPDGPFAFKNAAVGRILAAFDLMLALRRAKRAGDIGAKRAGDIGAKRARNIGAQHAADATAQRAGDIHTPPAVTVGA
ncbi:MAG: hypothetical protein KGL12_13775 [Rhodospirillales bacterium]|nr:hypothetical protein [Rhodospirillales bacterium]